MFSVFVSVCFKHLILVCYLGKREVEDRSDYGNDLLNDDLEEDLSQYTSDDFDAETLDELITGHLNVDDVLTRHRRIRRTTTKKDSIEHVTKIMESIEEELDDLKVSIFYLILMFFLLKLYHYLF